MLLSDRLNGCLQCRKLLILGALVVIALTQLVNGVFEFTLFLLDIDVIALEVFILLLGQDTVKLEIEVFNGFIELNEGFSVVNSALVLIFVDCRRDNCKAFLLAFVHAIDGCNASLRGHSTFLRGLHGHGALALGVIEGFLGGCRFLHA